MTKIDCSIIQDLLPLYVDSVCSKDSKILVEEHLKECEKCSKTLNEMLEDVQISKEDVQKIKNPFIKIKSDIIKRIVSTALVTILILIILFQIIVAHGYIIPLEKYKANQEVTKLMSSFINKDFETFSNSISYVNENEYNAEELNQMLNSLFDNSYENICLKDVNTYFEGFFNSAFLTGTTVTVYITCNSEIYYIEMNLHNFKKDKSQFRLDIINIYTNPITLNNWKSYVN